MSTNLESAVPYRIRFAHSDEWDAAMALAWKTFLVYEAPIYQSEGVESFENFITDRILRQMFDLGAYQMLVAIHEGEIIGLITLRDQTHISLLFVDERYHFRGVGRTLVERLCRYLRDEMGERKVTVNAAPYGINFYHKLGFYDIATEIATDGIRYTPMERLL